MAIAVSIVLDLRPPATELHPFAAVDLRQGSLVDMDVVRMRPVPRDLFEPVALPFVLGHPVVAGDPIIRSSIDDRPAAPPGSLLLELAVPDDTRVGDEITAVILSADHGAAPETVRGVVVGMVETDSTGPRAVCAFPAEPAPRVAAAGAENRVTVLRSG
jgi:hypothetical protein